MEAEVVAFGVLEPGGFLGTQHANVFHGLESRQVVALEHHTRLLQFGDAGSDVRDLEADRGVLGFGALWLGEEREELLATFRDLRSVDCDILTIGQYLRPTMEHLPLVRYYTPEEFAALRDDALAMGFKHVESGPLVRSSYHARDQVPSDSPALRGRRARDAATASTVRGEVA